ncbi:unnamed protein product [Psylliodes chrysocephalus]|uniref:BZIP domain-containing protein n=1 Tax=Psylliodes chrysocephalus TaxID=3402493 RepID=A0A9P0CLG0_9CUCU|nr:unnamed protein product [Psylliodes chrysocephala]
MLPILDDVEPPRAVPVPVQHLKSEYVNVNNNDTQYLLKEFETVYDVVEFAHGTLTPPQSPPSQQPMLTTLEPLLQYSATVPGDAKPIYAQPEKQFLSDNYALTEQVVYASVNTPQPDIAHELAVVDELVRTRVEHMQGSSSSSSSGCSSPRSPSSSFEDCSSDDPEWVPEPIEDYGDGSSPKLSRKRSRPYSKHPPEEKKVRKKEQNKNAATRYRMKKKAEIETILLVEKDLLDKNTDLGSKITDLNREINVPEESEKFSSGLHEKATNSNSSISIGSSSTSTSLEVQNAQNLTRTGSGEIDIGHYVNDKVNISDFDKYQILKKAFVPEKSYTFPYSVHSKNKKDVKCYLSQNHFSSFAWLTYSKSLNGLFCKCCVLFAKFGGIHKATGLQKLVFSPLQKYSKLYGKDGDLTRHNDCSYHKDAMLLSDNFKNTYENRDREIVNILNVKRIEQNRKKIKALLGTIHFLGKQNIPLRGHLTKSELTDSSDVNEGNLKKILRYRIQTSGDDVILKNHFESASSRTKYVSVSIQNELIKCCGEEILSLIVEKVNKSKYFSIMFDETTDISNISQMSIVIRYLDNSLNLREDFLGFVDCHTENYDECTKEPKLSGEILGNTVISFIEKLGLPFENCVGIGTDTCSVMLSEQKGAVSQVQKSMKNAVKCPCYNHSLNLSISKASTVQDIRNCVGIIKEIINFFKASPKRAKVLELVNNKELISLCETRWAERHDTVLRFQSCFEKIIETWELIAQWNDKDSSSKVRSFVDSLLTTQFMISLHCLSYFLSLTNSLSKLLQTKSLDKNKAQTLVNDILSLLNEKRKNVDSCFSGIFKDVKNLHKKMNLNLMMPRITLRQKHRVNTPGDSIEEYFRRSIFIPLLDNVIEDLTFRFHNELYKILNINSLIPSNIKLDMNMDCSLIKENVAEYLSNFTNESKDFLLSLLNAEFELWFKKWVTVTDENLPSSAISALQLCDKDTYQNVYLAVYLISTMPVNVASSERSFSTLKRLKTWLRSTMGQERLVALALLHIDLNIDAVLDRFAKIKKRHIDLIL